MLSVCVHALFRHVCGQYLGVYVGLCVIRGPYVTTRNEAECCGHVWQKLEARLGISTGKAVAGVMGTLQPRFTVLGVFIVRNRACDARENRGFVQSWRLEGPQLNNTRGALQAKPRKMRTTWSMKALLLGFILLHPSSTALLVLIRRNVSLSLAPEEVWQGLR